MPTSQTSMRRPRVNRFGFTMVEMMVVVTVLSLVSVAVVPSVVSMITSSRVRETKSMLRNMAANARELAIQNGQTMEIVYDSSSQEFEIQQVADNGIDPSTGAAPTADSNGLGAASQPQYGVSSANGNTTISVVHLLAGMEPNRLEVNGQEAGESDFAITFTPDGHSNGGGIEFDNFSILVEANGHAQLIDGQLPDSTDQTWQAGNLEQRN